MFLGIILVNDGERVAYKSLYYNKLPASRRDAIPHSNERPYF